MVAIVFKDYELSLEITRQLSEAYNLRRTEPTLCNTCQCCITFNYGHGLDQKDFSKSNFTEYYDEISKAVISQ
jgi:hypothetical protein